VLVQPLSKTVVLFGLPLAIENLCDLEQDTQHAAVHSATEKNGKEQREWWRRGTEAREGGH